MEPRKSPHRYILHAASTAAALVLAGCASPLDPQGVGNGQYLQIVKDDQVVAEMETSNVGLMNCPNQAYIVIQQAPALKGLIKCAHAPTPQDLPFGFTAHIQANESDGYRRSSPYKTKTSTAQLCDALLSASTSQEKTVITENHCGGK